MEETICIFAQMEYCSRKFGVESEKYWKEMILYEGLPLVSGSCGSVLTSATDVSSLRAIA
ncbi:unnamed protein product [Prunus brigantina]